MPEESPTDAFGKISEPIIRKFIENIESPFVWTPLGLFILCVMAFSVTQFDLFLYISIAFVILAFGADWIERIKNRQPPDLPAIDDPDYQPQISKVLAEVQAKAVQLLSEGKIQAARALTANNLKSIRSALESNPEDVQLRVVLGYTLKDVYQSSRGSLPQSQREKYLQEARYAFEQALVLAPDDAGAHNGIGNVLFFEGNFDAAIAEHDKALKIAGVYPAAEHDRTLVQNVKDGKIKFDF